MWGWVGSQLLSKPCFLPFQKTEKSNHGERILIAVTHMQANSGPMSSNCCHDNYALALTHNSQTLSSLRATRETMPPLGMDSGSHAFVLKRRLCRCESPHLPLGTLALF